MTVAIAKLPFPPAIAKQELSADHSCLTTDPVVNRCLSTIQPAESHSVIELKLPIENKLPAPFQQQLLIDNSFNLLVNKQIPSEFHNLYLQSSDPEMMRLLTADQSQQRIVESCANQRV